MRKPSAFIMDIGSESVSAAFYVTEAGMPAIAQVRSRDFPNASGGQTSELEKVALGSMANLLKEYGTASVRPHEAHVFLAAPWYEARLRAITSKSEKPVRITRASISRALEEYKKKHPDASSQGRAIESSVSQAYVNGYPTALEAPLRGSTLSVNLYESSGDSGLMQGIEDAVRSTFGGITVFFHSFPFAAYTSLRTLRPEENFIIVDVGGEITDCLVVSRDAIGFAGSFPYGARNIVRDVAGKGSQADAASRISLYFKNELHDSDALALRDSFQKAAEGWKKGFAAFCEKAAQEVPVPHTAFLFSGTEPLWWFKNILAEPDASSAIRAVPVYPDFFQSSITLGKEGVHDAFLAAEAYFLHSTVFSSR
jgi:hypothetical protein